VRPRIVVGAFSLVAGAAALVTGQALYATRRRDLPLLDGAGAAGCEGDPSRPPVRIVCFGDSTLTALGLDDPRDVWIRQAARAVPDRHVEIESFAAVGARAADVARRQVRSMLEARSTADVALVAVGTNDAVHLTPLAAVARDVEHVVSTLAEHVGHVVIGGVGDLGSIARVPEPLASLLTIRGRQVDRVIRNIVRARPGVSYVDVSTADRAFRAGGRDVYSPDLFHPNGHGHGLWAGVAAPVVAAAVRRVAEQRNEGEGYAPAHAHHRADADHH
jgi:lysophospholipase L1-like esterase